MKIKAHLNLNSKDLIKSVGLDENGKVQKYIDSFILNETKPFLPGQRHLYQSGVIGTEIGSGLIIWNSPDANYLYEGKLMVDPVYLKGAFFSENYGFWSRPNVQKIMDPQGRDLKNKKEGKDHWFDKAMQTKMDDLLNGISHIIDGGKK